MYGFPSLFVAVSIFFWKVANANPHEISMRHRPHPGLRNSTYGRENHLEKRFDNAKFTLYDAGLSACGGTYTDSQNVSFESINPVKVAYIHTDRRVEYTCEIPRWIPKAQLTTCVSNGMADLIVGRRSQSLTTA